MRHSPHLDHCPCGSAEKPLGERDREHGGVHGSGARSCDDALAFPQRGTRGAYVIDEEHAAAFDDPSVTNRKNVGRVCESVGADERRLLLRVARSTERERRKRRPKIVRERAREERRLVEAALGETMRVERHGDDYLDPCRAQMRG